MYSNKNYKPYSKASDLWDLVTSSGEVDVTALFKAFLIFYNILNSWHHFYFYCFAMNWLNAAQLV